MEVKYFATSGLLRFSVEKLPKKSKTLDFNVSFGSNTFLKCTGVLDHLHLSILAKFVGCHDTQKQLLC